MLLTLLSRHIIDDHVYTEVTDVVDDDDTIPVAHLCSIWLFSGMLPSPRLMRRQDLSPFLRVPFCWSFEALA